MSILLESLEQKGNLADDGIPNLGDSHFDDEMLSDEWLLEKIKLWQQIASALAFLLLISWGYFFLSLASVDKQLDLKVISNSEPKLPVNASQKSNLQTRELADPADQLSKQNQLPKSQQAGANKVSYKPQKISKNAVSPESNNRLKNNQRGNKKSKLESTKLISLDSAGLPEINISSYAISDNVKKSVVVINGQFYSQGEFVMPGVKLIAIKKEGILLEHNGQLELKKYP
ncbi:MAG: general secretion pathway protein GspB [Enterobacterales bacterium]|nr:general secretion pathway protein GspB [Enterobacterales bacterium]